MDNIFTILGLTLCFICNIVMLCLNEKGKLDRGNTRKIIAFLIIAFVLCVVGIITSILGVQFAIMVYKI